MGADKHGFIEMKAKLRSEIRAVLKNLPREKRKADSEKLRARLREQPFFGSAGLILFFAPLPCEIDVWPLLEESLAAGKIVALPRFDPASQSYIAGRVQDLKEEIVTGRFHIREPAAGCVAIPPENLDLVLVPGVAFDWNGRRLGRGGGFYDRLLRNVRGEKIGIAFDEQIVEEIPAEPHDARMNFVLTPTRRAAAR